MDGSYAFGGFRLDASVEILFRGAEPLPVGRRAVAVLRTLLERPGTPVSKDALIAAAWPGLAVEDSNLSVQIAALRKVLGEEPGGEKWIETLPRHGYRFVGPATTSGAATAVGAAPAPDAKLMSKGPSLPDKPSIAVLPFQNLSGDPEQEYFADGMVEEIVTALSRIPWLFVIARNSSFIYKGRAVNVKQVGRELGVRYVLEGSVRRVGNRIRITAQLIDAISDTHLWNDRFDGSLDDIFALQEKVAVSVAGVIEPTLQVAEIRRARGRPTSDLSAYDLYLRALPHARSLDKDRTRQALDLLNQAVERDPHYGAALALSAWCRIQPDVAGWTDNRDTNRRQAIDLARQALQVGGEDPVVLMDAAHVLAYFDEDITAAIGLMDRALELNPNFAHGWRWSGWIRLYAGEAELAIEHFQNSMRLSPRDRGGRSGIGIGLFFCRRFDEAAATLLLAVEEGPAHTTPYRFLASCYAHMGRLDEARETVRRLRAFAPVVVPSTTPYRNAEQRELLLSGLRLAVGDDEMR
jgi:adenylate cyclase